MAKDNNSDDKSIPTVDELPKNARRHGLLTCTSDSSVEPIEVVDSVALGTDGRVVNVVIPGADVAPAHARIWRAAAGAFLVEDLGSASGTYINDVKVQRRTLMLGDRVRLGASVVFEFTF